MEKSERSKASRHGERLRCLVFPSQSSETLTLQPARRSRESVRTSISIINSGRLPRFVGFPALRVLDLTCVDLPEDGDLVKDFLKSCPLLEDLSLSCCFIGELVCISCPKLKRLSIVNWDDVGPHGIKISCPKLVDLELGGCIMYGIRDSVVFHGNYHFKWAHLYFSFESIDDGCGLGLPNLKTLGLKTSIGDFTINELVQILKYYPKLEILKLTIYKDFNEKCVWLDVAEIRRLLNPDVKKVEFFEFNGEKPKVVKECREGELEMFFTWG